MEFLILGPLEVSDEGRTLALGGPKQRAVLAHLILRANRVVPADLLIDGLWGEDPPESARNTLQTYVYRLRKLLGEGRIEGRNGGYVLTAAPQEIDAARFEALVKQGKGRVATDPAAAASELDEGLALWRGEALANLADESSLRGEIARLEELRLAATEHRIAAEIAMGGHSTVVSELESLTARYPLRERMWANLMLALYRSGRQAEALDAYQRARQVLLDELGADPSPQLQHLNQQMLGPDPDLLGRSAPKPPTTVRHSKGDLPPGTEFAGYRIEAVLGRGGMSVVYLAEHLALGRKVALKLLAPQLADDDRFRERFVRESRIAAGMEHPNIVPIYEAGEAEGFLFIAMRYVPGTDLGRLIRREGTLDPGRALWIVRETASALDAAHGRGLVHRDVKPGNILVVPGEGSEGRDLVYLSDFGLTKRLESGTAGITQTGQFVGTVDYVAPEQIEGKQIDARADVYALACVLFECLTGRVPYERDTQVAALYAHLGEKPPPLTISRPDLPATIDAVVAKALSKTSEGRYATCGEFATAVRGTLGPLAGEPTPTADRSGWSRWQAGAVALVAALIAGVVVFSVFRGETPTAEDAASSPTPTMSLSPAPEPTFRTVERSLTTDEQRLLTSIPEDVGADCLPLDRAEPVQSELAALVCRNDDVEVLYELFPNRDLMDEAFQSNANINRAPEGECATDHLAVTPYTIGGEPAGRVLCYTAAIDANNQAGGPKTRTSHIEWTDENSAIYAHAIRNDLGDLTLYEWWLSSSGPLVSAEVGSAMAKDRPAAAAGRRLPEGSYLVSVDEPFERVSEVDLVAGNGGSLVTYRIHLEAGMYELARNGVIFDAGDILFEKPNLIVFDPLSGQCVGNEFSGQPSSYEWSASGSSLRWKLTEGTCAGPDQVPGKIAWTRAPSGVIAFSTQGQIFLMDAAGFNVEKLTGDAETGPNVSPTWSPDGTRIAFAGAGPEGFDLYSMNADGSGLEQLTDEAGDEIHPAFSPDGSRIAFAVDDPGVPPFRTSIVVVDPDGGDSTELTGREDEHVGWPVWSPDGRRIAFVGVTDRFNIYVMHADGSHVTKVHEEPRGPSFGLPLSWTPDGKRIVFWSERGKGTLLLMRPDGSDVREFVVRFPRSPYIGELVPDWSPDGRWIVMAGSWAPQALPQDLGTLVLLMRADGSEVFTVGYYVTEPSWRPP
jgi:serine/threonine protein kinase/Tol biopolymer transport system component/DNA-binding SARP family transcriptional activator